MAKTLSSFCRKDFDSDVRWRGEQYFRDGNVELTSTDPRHLRGTVQGTDVYEVSIQIHDSSALYNCTCPYFETVGPCKHLWSVIRHAEMLGVAPPTDQPSGTTEPGTAPRGSSASAGKPDAALSRIIDDLLADHPHLTKAKLARILKNMGLQLPADFRRPAPPPAWKQQLEQVLRSVRYSSLVQATPPLPQGSLLGYVLDFDYYSDGSKLLVHTTVRRPSKRSGDYLQPKQLRLRPEHLPQLDEQDRAIAVALIGSGSQWSYSYADAREAHLLYPGQQDILLPMMARTGRCFYMRDRKQHPLQLDEGQPWELVLEVRRDGEVYRPVVAMVRGLERRDLGEFMAILSTGWLVRGNTLARYVGSENFPWVEAFRHEERALAVPAAHGAQLLARLLEAKHAPQLRLPDELQFEQISPPCLPNLRILSPRGQDLHLELQFDYEGLAVPEGKDGAGVFQLRQKRWVRRDLQAEAEHAERLSGLGARADRPGRRLLKPNRLPRLVRELVTAGWRVEAEGKLYRRGGKINMSVSSGIDWLEVQGKVEFDGKTADLPDVLAALRKGETFVRLSDGSLGLLPEEWMEQYGLLARTGQTDGDVVRFKPTQAMLLDAMLAELPDVSVDEAFRQLRARLREHEGVAPVDPPASFVGTLRHYQREGLGWLEFLRRMGLGGCLADDMGLGKTIQVLALLEERRLLRARGGDDAPVGPTLAVVPRSLVFNWRQEAERFTPQLRVLDHTGTTRGQTLTHLRDYDLVLTTYGTMRQDIDQLKDYRFDYIILDEAQAIKNAQTASAKASRLLNARHRLCLSGTPIENHLGELWSQLEFLNPGLLGTWAGFGDGREISDKDRQLLARVLRPFILRRTKEQVASELPSCTEQTIYCQLKGPQRQLYDELRAHYRSGLLTKVDAQGLGKSKMQILEALLRLRQAACHGGLLDPEQAGNGSAKLDALLAQLQEVIDEGHKALVFSQFTSLLALVKPHLDTMNVPYEYLDGRTRSRQEKVERFQNDPKCPVFLISLKAGGLGLNLTAADYVFLLDPWWNPAVEAQAIDRAHRIGQTRQVFAYRLIAKDTIEEKVLQLQQSKRELADSIITADNSLIRDITREDLEMLLA